MKQMDYLEFCEQIFKELRENENWNLATTKMKFFQNGCKGEGEDKRFIRNTNKQYFDLDSDSLRGDWLVIYNKSSECEFPMQLLYEIYKRDGIETVWLQFQNKLNESKTEVIVDSLKDLWDYEKKKDSLIMRIHRYDGGDCDAVGFQHGDIAVTLHTILQEESDGDVSTMLVRNSIAECWGHSEFDLITDAFINMIPKASPTLIIESPEPVEISILQQCSDVLRYVNIDCPLIVSNEWKTEGAVTIFYPQMQEIISSLLQGDFFAIMPTCSCVQVYPASVSEDAVRNVLYNELQAISSEDTLSKKVYFYECSQKRFHVL